MPWPGYNAQQESDQSMSLRLKVIVCNDPVMDLGCSAVAFFSLGAVIVFSDGITIIFTC